jgi:hypothetical protein
MLVYKTGNLFDYVTASDNICIAHITNNCHQWGAGFVVPLAKNFPAARETYMRSNAVLGQNNYSIEKVLGRSGVLVANMCCQDNKVIRPVRLRYGQLVKCMLALVNHLTLEKSMCDKTYKIYAPLFGSGIAGGNWYVIENMIQDIWRDLDVTIFQMKGSLVRPEGPMQ